jgi:signal transduction histidine kinase
LSLSDTQASHLYRIAQEALANAARHGQAKVVDVLLVITHHMLLLRIADDGCGLARDSRPAGMGLKIMEYRAGMLGARLEVCANLPRGTVVRVIGEAPQLALRL